MIIVSLFKVLRKILFRLTSIFYTPYAKLILFLNGVKYSKDLKVNEILKVFITRRGIVIFDENISINSGNNHNIVGRQQKTIFWVEGKLTVGHNTGMSSTALICNHEIEIGNNVNLGGNTIIYDTDFHAIDPKIRLNKGLDKKEAKKAIVKIGNNVFTGAHSTILKGVTIGDNAVVGACSLVSKDIPTNEIWVGNPIRFIGRLKGMN
jgi:acetyltransferase-like isoleucine patch superfamily enzyme